MFGVIPDLFLIAALAVIALIGVRTVARKPRD